MNQIATKEFVFQKGNWNSQGKGREFCLSGIPGTWYDPSHHKEVPTTIQALVCCPKCKKLLALNKTIHAIDALGKVTPILNCTNRQEGTICGFSPNVYLDMWADKPLYAMAIERFNGKEWAIELHYTHANNIMEAERQLVPGNHRIIGIGRAIAYKVEDKVGKILSA